LTILRQVSRFLSKVQVSILFAHEVATFAARASEMIEISDAFFCPFAFVLPDNGPLGS
jgi:hypothetical protein